MEEKIALQQAEIERLKAEKQHGKFRKQLEYEQKKDKLVNSLSEKAEDLQKTMQEFKQASFDELQAFYGVLKEFAGRKGGEKGNFLLYNSEKNLKIEYNVQTRKEFNELAGQGEKLILEFVSEQFANSPADAAFIKSLLERKQGVLDINMILKLLSLRNNYSDDKWEQGLDLLAASYQEISTVPYVRFYKLDEKGSWKNISLNFGSL